MGPAHYPTWQEIIVSETSNAVLGSIGSPALCCTQKRNPLFEIILSTGLTTPHATVEQGRQRRVSVSGWGGIVRDFSKAATDFLTLHRTSSRDSGAVIATSAGVCDASRQTSTCFTQDGAPLRFSMGIREHQTAAFSAQWSFGVLDLQHKFP